MVNAFLRFPEMLSTPFSHPLQTNWVPVSWSTRNTSLIIKSACGSRILFASCCAILSLSFSLVLWQTRWMHVKYITLTQNSSTAYPPRGTSEFTCQLTTTTKPGKNTFTRFTAPVPEKVQYLPIYPPPLFLFFVVFFI